LQGLRLVLDETDARALIGETLAREILPAAAFALIG
jgi:hypothetical protein